MASQPAISSIRIAASFAGLAPDCSTIGDAYQCHLLSVLHLLYLACGVLAALLVLAVACAVYIYRRNRDSDDIHS